MRPLSPTAAAGAATFVAALALDLYSKVLAIHFLSPPHVYFNHANPNEYIRRIVMSVAAIAVTYALDRGARRLGIGRLWGAWVGAGLLAGGVIGNGVSRLIWSRGVPDFIYVGRDIWNVADFEIGIGVTGGIVSVAVCALIAFVRERIAAPAVDRA